MGINIQPPKHVDCSSNSHANNFAILYHGFFEQWSSSCSPFLIWTSLSLNFPVCQLFQNTVFASFNAILSLLPFLLFLFVLTSPFSFHYFYFPHNPLSFSLFSISSFLSSFTHHSHHIINPSCRRKRVKFLPAIRGKWSLLMTHPLRPRKTKRLPISNGIVLRRRKEVATLVVSTLLSSIHGMIPTYTSWWCLVTIRLLCQAVFGYL